MGRQKTHFIQSLAKGLSILQAFSSERPKLTLTQLASLTGLNVVAVQRYTDTLMKLGFLRRSKHKEFSLGPKVLSLGFACLQGPQLLQLAVSHLREFSERLGRTVNMSILDGTEIIFVYRHEIVKFLKYNLTAGSKLPAHCTSSGKVLLAGLDDEELKQRIQRMNLERVTSYTITDSQELLEEIHRTRDRGIGISDRELSLDLYTIGVPILDYESRLVAAITMPLPYEEAAGQVLEETIQELVEQGRQLSELIGYRGEYPVIPLGSWRSDYGIFEI